MDEEKDLKILPKPALKSRRIGKRTFRHKNLLWILPFVVLLSAAAGFGGGLAGGFVYEKWKSNAVFALPFKEPDKVIERTVVEKEYVPQTSEEQKIIDVAKKTASSVVSIVIKKNTASGAEAGSTLDKNGKPIEEEELGEGSGFVISKEGMVLTNKHVVREENATYTISTSEGKSYPAIVLARDPLQDLAVLKIDQQGKQMIFTPLLLGDSEVLEIGQTVVAVGNSLGEFNNTVSVGVISGLGRTITASGGSFVETIEDVIQTDAAINKGNSGGPLLNLAGEVIGVNTAMVVGAQSMGFAIPVNEAKRGIEQVKVEGRISYALLGVRYSMITRKLQQEKDLTVDYGALVMRGGQGEPAVAPDSAAAKAGIREGDVLIEINGERLTQEYTLAKAIKKRKPGDKIVIKVWRDNQEKIFTAVLGEVSG